jgi:hypothetical protein
LGTEIGSGITFTTLCSGMGSRMARKMRSGKSTKRERAVNIVPTNSPYLSRDTVRRLAEYMQCLVVLNYL